MRDRKKENKTRLLYGAVGLLGGAALALAGGNDMLMTLGFAIGGLIVGLLLPGFLQKRKKKKELRMYEIDMADYLIGVSLLLSSGQTLWDALRRGIAGADLKKPLYRDISRLFDGIDMGKYNSPVEAFEQLASECGSPQISTLTQAIVQNYRKDSAEVASLFADLSVSARNNRKYVCMKLADEATTLLLIPSVMVLVAIMGLLLTPAVLMLAGM